MKHILQFLLVSCLTLGLISSVHAQESRINDEVEAVQGQANHEMIPVTPTPVLASPNGGTVIYNNGPYVTHPGGGPNGTHGSVLQSTTFGMTTIGFGITGTIRVADDFTVTAPGGWRIDSITVNGYLTGADTTSAVGATAMNFRIWSGVPDNVGSTVVFGDTTTNRLTTNRWNREVRYTQTAVATNRALKVVTASAGVTLPPGTYWLEWNVTGLSFAPPITITGDTVTGNARQRGTTGWVALLDGTKPQGMPFLLHGQALSSGGTVTTTRRPNLFIPDNTPAGVFDTLTVSGIPAGTVVRRLSVSIDSLTHTWVGDFRMTLTHAGVTRTLMNRPGTGTAGSSGDNFIGTVLVDSATRRIDSIAATGTPPNGPPYTGYFKPDSGGAPTIVSSSLAPFNGTDPNGQWILFVSDNAGADTGRVRQWSVIIEYGPPTSVNPIQVGLPDGFTLSQNYPNPFNPTTTIQFGLPVAANVTLKVYNVLGQEVATLVDGQQRAGTFQAVWNGRSSAGNQVASGMYFYSLIARSADSKNTFTNIKKMLLLK